MITEPEMAGGPQESGPAGDVVGSGDGRKPGRRPWTWVAGAVVVTSAMWGLVLRGTGYGHDAGPDLHGYRLTGSPCAGDNLKPLTDAFGTDSHEWAGPAELRTGPALDQAQCVLMMMPKVVGQWRVSYRVTVTAELHKETDPAAEFEDRNRPHGPNLDPVFVVEALDETDRVVPVAHLGDSAYLLVGDDNEQALTVRHGGAVFTVDIAADSQWVGSDEMPPDADGMPPKAPGLSRFRPALTDTVRRIMADLTA